MNMLKRLPVSAGVVFVLLNVIPCNKAAAFTIRYD